MMLNSGVSLVALDLMLLRNKISGCQLPFDLIFFLFIFFINLTAQKLKKILRSNLREIEAKSFF